MIENNLGKLIGVLATANATSASGVFTLDQYYDQIQKNLWPFPTYAFDFLVVAGGGGGGSLGGGGGGGGVVTGTYSSVSKGTVFTITVGNGGSGQAATLSTPANSGANSSISSSSAFFGTVTAIGGGRGGSRYATGAGATGGSGGGSATLGVLAGGLSTQSSFNTSVAGVTNLVQYGNSGFSGGYTGEGSFGLAAGGGAGGGGGPSGATSAINGGVGIQNAITGTNTFYAGGGGAGGNSSQGIGGSGGGGTSGYGSGAPNSNGFNGTPSTGGGGGGGTDVGTGGNGGSGVVILSIPTANYSGTVTGSPAVSTNGSFTVLRFTDLGTYTA